MLPGRLDQVISGVSQLHLKAALGPRRGPGSCDHRFKELRDEAQGVYQQCDAQKERPPLGHTGLLLLQVLSRELDAVPGKEASQRLEDGVQLLCSLPSSLVLLFSARCQASQGLKQFIMAAWLSSLQ